MAKITIEINTDNAAFWDDFNPDVYNPNPEINRILSLLANESNDFSYSSGSAKLRDINGNICGFIKIESED